MHYRHRYHAGNFADVFKHMLLCGLLSALSRKDKPWCYFETHAGAGEYDLGQDAATRTGEFGGGIGRLAGLENVPQPLADYLAIVSKINGGGALRHYPGSPLIAHVLAREHDRLVFCEKVPEVAEELRSIMRRDARAAVHQRDGYELLGMLPPKEKRGLVLIDPAFEDRKEFEAMGDFIVKGIARFAGGVFAAWYPLKNEHEADRFGRRMQRELTRPVIDIRFDNGAPAEGQMHGCGMLIVNPPFQFAQEIEPALKLLVREIKQGPKPSHSIEILRAE